MDKGKLSKLMSLTYIPGEKEREENLKYCHVCLKSCKLTEEHIPPEKAFNENDRLWERLVFNKHVTTRKIFIRGGFWVKTLCPKCNNEIGALYAKEYIKFVKYLVSSPPLFDSSGKAKLLTIHADTLLIAKEIAIMILAFENINFVKKHNELRKFVLDKNYCFTPPFRILSFLVPEVERAGTLTKYHARVDAFAPGYKFSGGEISCFPFGFVYAYDIGKNYEVEKMTDITDWFNEFNQTKRINYSNKFFTRISGVESMHVILGHQRVRPQIDYLN